MNEIQTVRYSLVCDQSIYHKKRFAVEMIMSQSNMEYFEYIRVCVEDRTLMKFEVLII